MSKAQIQPDSETWHAIKDDHERRIEQLQRQLEQRGLPADETEFLRGQIKALRTTLIAAKPASLASSELMQPVSYQV